MRLESEDGSEPVKLTETQTLILRAKQGEDLAFTELYARHAGRVRHSVATRLGGYDVPDLEDVVQETFLYAFKMIRENRFEEGRTQGGFRHWLAKVAVNKVRDGIRQRKTKRRGAGLESVMRDALSSSSRELFVPSPIAQPSEVLMGKELEAEISKTFAKLSERQREIIDLRDHCEMSFAEIADEMEGSPATLRSLYKRAKEDLRQLLSQNGIQPL